MTTKEILLKDLHYLEVLLQEYVSKKSQPDSYEKVASDLVGAGFSIKKDMSLPLPTNSNPLRTDTNG